MAWTYTRLWIMLMEKKLKRTDLISLAGINSHTLARMGKDQPVTLENLGKICQALHCNIESVIQYIPDEMDEN